MAGLGFLERFKIPVYDDEGVVRTGKVAVDEELCNGCGVCVSICPGKALEVYGEGKQKKARMHSTLSDCNSCNACSAICERDAIAVVSCFDFNHRYKTLDRGEMVPPRRF